MTKTGLMSFLYEGTSAVADDIEGKVSLALTNDQHRPFSHCWDKSA